MGKSKASWVGWAVLVLGTHAWAGPGDLSPREDKDCPIEILDAQAASKPCALKNGLCLTAGARTTIAVESAAVVAVSKGAAPVVPRFARAQGGTVVPGASEAQWTLDLTGTLKRPAWSGNALFLFFDLDDPGALENRQYTAFYQTALKAGSKLAAHLTLQPDEGFRAGHTYRLRIIQLINGKEILLGETDASLL
jgi:hypothetical protein